MIFPQRVRLRWLEDSSSKLIHQKNMLKTLLIKNYALLVDEEIQFGDKLNILTGETGAGKTIILNALGTILGDRVNNSFVREGASKAIIEGIFQIEENVLLLNCLEKNDLALDDEQMILRREIFDNNRSRAFVNDTPVQLSTLQEIGELVVDLHGQHDHQSLLKIKNHLTFLDEFGSLEPEVQEVAESYQKLQKLMAELNELENKQESVKEKREHYTFQINEINKVDPSPDEEKDLLKEENVIQNRERLFNLTNEFFGILYEGDNSVLEQLGRVTKGLRELQEIDEEFRVIQSDCESAKLTVEEISKFLQSYKSNIDFNPQRVEELQNRIAALAGLKKKFGGSLQEAVNARDKMQAELASLENLDSQITSLNKRFASEKATLSALCFELSKKRKNVAMQLDQLVPDILSYLGMPAVRFKVTLKYQDDPIGVISVQGQHYRATASGMDFVEFFISTNKGEELRPLAKVASGGEISRVMLALKSLLAKKGRIPVLVFDEIDSGVSGAIAQSVGRKLKELSEFHQVICITHLPQIASIGDFHLLVEKVEKMGRVETNIRKLTSGERTEAIAKLLAGEKISETHLESARELLQDATLN